MSERTTDPAQAGWETSEVFQLAFEHAPIGIVVADPGGTLRWANLAVATMLGRTRESLIGMPYLAIMHPADVDQDGVAMQEALASGAAAYTIERRCVRGDGTELPVQIDVSLVDGPGGEPRALVAHVQDITERQRVLADLAAAQAAMQASSDRFAALVEQSSDLTCVVDAEGCLTYVSPAAEQMLGFDDETWRGFEFLSIVHPHDRVELRAAFEDLLAQPTATAKAEARLMNSRGQWRHVEIAASNRISDPAVAGVVANVRDVTERTEAAARISWQAFHDPLTGLPNRALFNDRLSQALARGRRGERLAAVLFLDLDRFKLVNDSLGHEAGDLLLVEVARRLTTTVRDQDTIARLGGDEFVVLVEGMGHDDVLGLARRIARVVAQPIELEQGVVNTSTSIGIAFAQPDAGAATLLRDADTALYRAKEKGRNRFHVFTESLRAAALRRMEVEHSLRAALAEERLVVHFQPMVDLTTGEVVAAEALVRFDDGHGNLELPGEYLEVADDTGLIVEVGQHVRDVACQSLVAWRSRWGDRAPQRVALNVAARELVAPDFLTGLLDALDRHGLEPGDLSLEFPESTILSADREVLRTVDRLREQGMVLSVDDFGTGYSSLASLKRFPIGSVKLERSFVAGLGVDPSDAEIVRAVVSLGEALALDVVAEGIETPIQLQLLQEAGCSYGQGFFLGVPAPADVLDPERVAAVIGATSAGWAVAGS
jgi:diguanylate cyclase (GGDEF)-like protein/PAS domain S-box-containing protein